MTTKVFIACSGLGRIKRGFEKFAGDCYEQLRGQPNLEITLFKGGGTPCAREVVLWSLPREQWLASFIGRCCGKTSYNIEQIAFTLSLIPHVMREKPDVIYFADWSLGKVLNFWRRLTRQKFKLLLCNGAAYEPPFPHCDHIQQVSLPLYQSGLAAGHTESDQSLVPHALHLQSTLPLLTEAERYALRKRLHLPVERPIVLSVAVLDIRIKRIDYIIREVAALPEPRPFLLMVGQETRETPRLRALATELLGRQGFDIRTVAHHEVGDYYCAGDLLVLASLMEGFGFVLVEALSHGLPCLTHRYGVPEFVLGEFACMADFTHAGALAALLEKVLSVPNNDALREARHASAYARFSWDRLRPCYAEMIEICAGKTNRSKNVKPRRKMAAL